VKTKEQREAAKARARARRERRTNEGKRRDVKTREATTRHRTLLAMIEDMDGVWLENKDGGVQKWRLTTDEGTFIVEAAKGRVMSTRRA
jgi:hypothetical protein